MTLSLKWACGTNGTHEKIQTYEDHLILVRFSLFITELQICSVETIKHGNTSPQTCYCVQRKIYVLLKVLQVFFLNSKEKE